MPMADGYIVPYNLTTVSQVFTASMSEDDRTVQLQHYVFSLGVQNTSSSKNVTIYINKYTNDSVIVPPNSYKEIAVTTDWYKLVFEGGHDKDVIVDRVETEDPDFLMTPLFPNLFQSKDQILTLPNESYSPEDEIYYFVVTKLVPGQVTVDYVDTNSTTGTITLNDYSTTTPDPYGNVVTYTKIETSQTVSLDGYPLESIALNGNGSVKISLYSNRNYNPINSGGYTYTPWSVSDGSSSVAGADSVVKIDYYLNGIQTTTSSTNFYADFANMIFDHIQGFYPVGYDPTNPQYDPAQFANIVSKTRTFFDSIKATSIHDQYIGGWALMTDYNKDLSLYSFTLDGAESATSTIELPFTALGFTLEKLSGSSADVIYTDSNGDTHTVNLASSTPVVVNDSAKIITVDDPEEVKITFSGNLLKIMDFAPVINIVYPLGFDEASGRPDTEYQSFTSALTAFENQLKNNKFTGRVLYFRAIPFGPKVASEVWTADYIIPEYLPKDFKLVFKDLQPDVYNWYVRSNMETDLLKVIAWENRDIYYEDGNLEPTTLDEVINNDDVSLILGQSVLGATENERVTFKLNVIKKFLLNEYNGPYSMGGLNFFRFGFNL